jgi:pimeloyl-ACP methyl ester carboxylesterase
LSTHIQDVVNHILYEDLRDIVLLGFSHGGFVVTGAVEHIGDRVKHLVFLDAFMPRDGETLIGHISGANPSKAEIGENWSVPVPEGRPHFDDAAEAELDRRSAYPAPERML